MTHKPNFPRHEQGTCTFCDHACPELCAAYQTFLSDPSRESWKRLRGFLVMGSGRFVPKSVWQLVCASEGITNCRGGRFSDDGDVPSVDEVVMALAISPVTVEG